MSSQTYQSVQPGKITNSRVLKFYETYPTFDINTVNLFMIDMLQNMINANLKDTITMQDLQSRMAASMVTNESRNQSTTTSSIKSGKSTPVNVILTKLYNSGEINILENNANEGTFSLKRIRKQNVIIKSICSDENVSIDELESFTQLVNEKNGSGILISQNSGIATKKDFQIEIHNNNNIIVYVHNSNYSETQIETAVSIIDNLYAKLRQFSIVANDSEIMIPKDVLDIINTEYQLFITQKTAIVELLKENQKKVISQMEEFRFPGLDKFLAGKFAAPVQKPGLKCELCKGFTAHNLKALAAHKRGCIRKQVKLNVPASSALIVNSMHSGAISMHSSAISMHSSANTMHNSRIVDHCDHTLVL